MIALAWPWVLALLPLPFLVRALFPEHREQRDAVRSPFVGVLAELLGERPRPGAVVIRRRILQTLMFTVSWILVVVALARPQWIGEPIVRELPTRDILLAVDLSGSMEAEDFPGEDGELVERLSAVKSVLTGFLERRHGDRVALVFFGTSAFVQSPFTEDLDVLALLLDEAQVRMAGPRTAIGDAIGLAIRVFEDSDVEDRVMIVLTDGNDTGSAIPPDRAASIAAERGITIHAVAVGDPTTAGEDPLDEQALRDITLAAGGIYAHASDAAELDEIYATIDALKTRDAQTQSYRPRRELFQWPLGLFTLLTLLMHGLVTLPAWLRLRQREQAGAHA